MFMFLFCFFKSTVYSTTLIRAFKNYLQLHHQERKGTYVMFIWKQKGNIIASFSFDCSLCVWHSEHATAPLI